MGMINEMKAVAQERAKPLSELIKETQELNKSLELLPEAIVQEISEHLNPLKELKIEVNNVLKHYDQIAQAQRSTIETVTTELTDQATAKMLENSKKIETILNSVSPKFSKINKTVNRGVAVGKALGALKIKIDKQISELKSLVNQKNSSHLKTSVITGLVTGLIVSLAVYLPVIVRSLR